LTPKRKVGHAFFKSKFSLQSVCVHYSLLLMCGWIKSRVQIPSMGYHIFYTLSVVQKTLTKLISW